MPGASSIVTDPRQQPLVARVFRLVHDVQAGLPHAVPELDRLSAEALAEGWGQVRRACLFAQAVRAWVLRDGDPSVPLEELIAESEAADDEVMLALGLAMRSDPGFSGGDQVTAAARDQDLARAVAMLDAASGRVLERISAHTAAGIAFGNRWLFELSEEQYARALDIGAVAAPGELDFILAPIVFNLAEQQVSWASKLRQLDDSRGVAERFAEWSRASAATSRYQMVEAWKTELDAHGHLLAAIAGNDTADEARALLAGLGDPTGGDQRAAGLLLLAIALADADAGRPQADAETERAIAALTPEVHPFPYDLALFLSATLESRKGATASLRYARRAVEEQWAKRLGSLGAMQARIDAERLAAERELLSRHARLDDLTGVANRRGMEQFLSSLERRGVELVGLILFDVDAFKSVNDRHGHLAGDAVLVRIARVLERGIRSSDLAVRLGGDEFAVVLPGIGVEAACERARRLLETMSTQSFGELSDAFLVALSAGVAAGEPKNLLAVRAAADSALYRAKRLGGNRVVGAGVDDP